MKRLPRRARRSKIIQAFHRHDAAAISDNVDRERELGALWIGTIHPIGDWVSSCGTQTLIRMS